MIFVTVGTHEQQFNRLIEYIDKLKESGIINENIIMQIGYCTYEPKCCKWSKFLPYKEMINNIEEARIVITHGGPSSFIMPLQIGKIPIVVSRQKQFDEHVNNHQVEFVELVSKRHKNIIPVFDINLLEDTIKNYESIVSSLKSNLVSNNERFNNELSKIINELFSLS